MRAKISHGITLFGHAQEFDTFECDMVIESEGTLRMHGAKMQQQSEWQRS